MNDTFIYAIQVIVASGFFYGFYKLFMEKGTHFAINRFYLLITLFLSLVIPFIQIPIQHEFTTTDKLFAGYNAPLSINIRPKCSAMTCNLKEAKILVEFQLTSEDDVSYNKCVRRGPSYVIYVKGQ
jgi:hypothetical protein